MTESPRDEALDWWQRQVEAERYVGRQKELPSAPAERYLLDQRLLVEPPGRWGWVVTSPDQHDGALRQNYWRLIRILQDVYAPAAVERISAIRLHMGEASIPPLLHVIHSSSASQRRLEIVPGLAVALRSGKQAARAPLVETVEVDRTAVRVVTQARLLTSLTVTDIRDNRDLVLTWLRSLVLAQRDLEAAYEADPRPVLLARIGHLAQEVGNRRLAEQIARVAAAHQRAQVSRTLTGVNRELVVPAYVVSQPSLREPWLDRYRARLSRAAEVAQQVVAESRLASSPLPRSRVLAQARRAKLDDTYHSTTIEGYRVTREQVRTVLEGMSLDSPDRAEMERLVALKGYSQAFERTLSMIADADPGGLRLSEADVLDLYEELWGPSVDAGMMTAAQLRGWRKEPVYIRGSDYVPPAPGKVTQLMRVWADTLNEMEADAVSRATVAHWGFVHVHPFMDGNGRLSRLLMNLVLCAAGLPWTIIRAEERREYFGALEIAHVREDYAPFARFVAERVGREAGG
jgi:Fic family protein